MIVCSIAIQTHAVYSLRHSIDWMRLAPFVLGGAITVPFGIFLLTHLSATAFSLGMGLWLMLYGGYMLLRKSDMVVRGNAFIDFLFGAAGGVTGGMAAFPGAFVTIWCGMRGWNKDYQRGIFQPYILAMQLLALALLNGSVQRSEPSSLPLFLIPIVMLAAHLGLAVFRKLSNRQFSCALYALLIVAGFALALKFV